MANYVESTAVQINIPGNMLQRIGAKLIVWNNKRLAIRALQAMPDYLLKDIGIERCQIREVVWCSLKAPIVSLASVTDTKGQEELHQAA